MAAPDTLMAFNLQIVTPEREVYNSQVVSVSLPGVEGSFGVLTGHAPLVAALEAGSLDITDAQGRDSHMAIGGGFFQVMDDQAMVLADSAERAEDIDVSRAQESADRARQRLGGQLETGLDLQRDRATEALRRAEARMRVAQKLSGVR